VLPSLPKVVRRVAGKSACGTRQKFTRQHGPAASSLLGGIRASSSTHGSFIPAAPLGFGPDFEEPTAPIDRSKILKTVEAGRVSQLSMDEPIQGIPKPLHTSLEKPEIKISTLSNGLRVISHETFGQISNVGLSIAVGSRFEDGEEKGLNHLLEFMMMKGTRHRSHQKIVEEMEQMGAHVSIKTGREQMMMHIDVLRDNTEQAVELLCENITSPLFYEEEIEHQKMSMALDYEHLHLSSIEMINEIILEAAYGPDSELGAYYGAHSSRGREGGEEGGPWLCMWGRCGGGGAPY
jgi:hypothetical protein